jgi:hypothetical protein
MALLKITGMMGVGDAQNRERPGARGSVYTLGCRTPAVGVHISPELANVRQNI